MQKVAFLFPGQGAQYVGMGKDFYEQIPVSRAVFAQASEVSGMDLCRICFTEKEKLDVTAYTQIAMLTASAAMLEALKERLHIAGAAAVPCVSAGLSLGEYGALVSCGGLSFADAVRVVAARGRLMQEAVPVGGAMSAVIGLDAARIESVLRTVDGCVGIANYNCPGQVVITGEAGAVAAAGKKLQEAGARRILPLRVSGPFHSPLLAEAGRKLGEVLQTVQIRSFQTPYVTNVTAEYVRNAEEVKDLLEKQVSSPVKWQQSVERMLADGVTDFVEIGPGKTLSGFVKKISREAAVYQVGTVEDLDLVTAAMTGKCGR